MNTISTQNPFFSGAKAFFRLAVLFCMLFVGVGSVSGENYTSSRNISQADITATNVLGLSGWGNPTFTLTEDIVCAGITIAESARLNLNGHTITVNGNVSTGEWNGQGIDIPAGSSLVVTGNVFVNNGASIAGSGDLYYGGTLTIGSNGGSVSGVTGHNELPATDVPTIKIPGNLAGFSTTPCEASPSQSFNVSGENLEGAVTVTIPSGADFEISSDGTTWGNSFPIPASGTLSNTTLYARLKTGLTEGAKTATITLTSPNAPNKTISLSGNVSAPTCGFEFDYNPAWCNGIPFEDVKTGNFSGNDESCYFITDMTNSQGHKPRNGKTFLVNGANGRTACQDGCNNLRGIAKADGGWYIYTPAGGTDWTNWTSGTAPTPTAIPCPASLTTSTTNISDLGYAECGTPSSKIFNVAAPNPCDITVNVTGGDTDAFVVTKNGGVVTVTMKPGYSAGTTKTATITVGDGATTQTVTVSGTVSAASNTVTVNGFNGSSLSEAVSECELGCASSSYQFGINDDGNGVFALSFNGNELKQDGSNVTFGSGINGIGWCNNCVQITQSGYVKLTYTPGAAKPYTLNWSATKFLCGATLEVTGTSSTFNACTGSASATQTFNVSGALLTSNVEVTLEGTDAAAFEIVSPTVPITASGTLGSTPVVVRLKSGQTAGAKSAQLVFRATGATDKTVNLTGSVTATTLTAIPTVNMGTVCAGNTYSGSFVVKGSCFTSVPAITAVAGYTITGTTPASPTVADVNGTGITVNLTRDAVATDNLSDAAAVTISGGGLTNPVTVSTSGTVNNPVLTAPATHSVPGYAECGSPTSNTIAITTNACSDNVSASSLTNFDIVSVSNSSVELRLKAGLPEGTYTEMLTLTSGFLTQTVSVSGTVTAPEMPNFTISGQSNTTNISAIDNCEKGCTPSFKFSFRGAANNNVYVSIKDGDQQLTDANTTYDSKTYAAWSNGGGFGTGDNSYENKTFWVKITKDPTNPTKPYTLEFIEGAGNEPLCGPSIKINNVTFAPVCPTTAYVATTATVTGANLTDGGILITPQPGYIVNGNTTPFTLPATAGSVNTTVTVERTATAGTAAFTSENAFVASSSGGTDVTVKASGDILPTTIDLDKTTVTIPTICPTDNWTREAFTISTLDCPVGTTTASITGDFNIYDAPAGGNLVNAGNLNFNTPYYIEPANKTTGIKTGSITVTNNGASATVNVSAEVVAGATLSHSGASTLNFAPVCASEGYGNGTKQSFVVTGSCLSTTITIDAQSGFQVSANGTTWANSLTGITSGTAIYVKPSISAAGEQKTNAPAVVISSPGATSLTINASAEVKTPSHTIGMPSGNTDYFENAGPGGNITINASTNGCYTTGFTTALCNENADDNAANFTITQGATLGTAGGDITVQLNGGLPADTYTVTVCITTPDGTITQVPVEATVSNVKAIYSNKTGDWCTADTWSSVGCGGGGTTDIPGTGANIGVAVVICAPYTVNLDCNVTGNVHSITVESGATLHLNTADIVTECDITVNSGGQLLIGTARKDFSLPPMINSKVVMQSGALFNMDGPDSYGVGIGENCDWQFADDVNFTQRVALMNSSPTGQGKISSAGTLTFSSVVPKENAVGNWIGGAIFQSTKTTIKAVGSGSNRNTSWTGPTGNGVNLHLIGPTEIQNARYSFGTYKFEGGDLEFTGAFGADGTYGNPPSGFSQIEFISPDANSDLKFSGTAMSTVTVPFNAYVKGNVYFEKGDAEDAKSTNFAYEGTDRQQIEANNVYFKNQFFVYNGEMNIKSNLIQTGNAQIYTEGNQPKMGTLHISGNLNSQASVKCPSDGGYSLLLNLGASNQVRSYFTVGNNMWANIKDDSNMRDYLGVLLVYGNAYMRGFTPGAKFGKSDVNGTINIRGKLVLEDLILQMGVKDNVMVANQALLPSEGGRSDNRLYSGPREADEYTGNWGYSSCCPEQGVVKDYKGDTVTGSELGNFLSLCGSKVIAVDGPGKLCPEYADEYPYHNRPEHSPISDCNDASHITQQNCIDLNEDGDTDEPGECTDGLYATVGGDYPYEPDFPDGWLPVELVEFTAELKGQTVVLDWSTLTETDNDYFTVQRSQNGRSFNALGEELGAGTTVIPQHYSYVDNAPLAGVSYYRLKQTDIDGKYSYSNIVPIYNTDENKTFEVFKTTTNSITRLECVFADTTIINRITIHSITGKLEFEKDVAPQYNPYVVELPLAPGVYLVSNLNRHAKTVVKILVTH